MKTGRAKRVKTAKKDRPLRRAAVSLLLGLVLALAVVRLSAAMEFNRSVWQFGGQHMVWAPSYRTHDHGRFYDEQGRLHRWRVERDIGVRKLDVLRQPDPVTERRLFNYHTGQGNTSKPVEARLGAKGLWIDGVPAYQRLYTIGFGWPLPGVTSVAVDDGRPRQAPPASPTIDRPQTLSGFVAWTLIRGFQVTVDGTRLAEPRIYWLGLLINTLSFAALSHLFAGLIQLGVHAWATRKISGRERRGLCLACGYSRAQTPGAAACPECGHTPEGPSGA